MYHHNTCGWLDRNVPLYTANGGQHFGYGGGGSSYTLQPVSGSVYNTIVDEWQQRASGKNKQLMHVKRVQQIHNPTMRARYELKKYETLLKFNRPVHCLSYEYRMYHGTLRANLQSICAQNLDPARCKTHRFGYGVSFSPDSYYATHYCDKDYGDMVMLVCKVLVINSVDGDESMLSMPFGCDTFQSSKRNVFVKNEKDTYLPEYVITFNMTKPNYYYGYNDWNAFYCDFFYY